jgi:hypothetical protein
MNQYIGVKAINATKMTRLAYNRLRGWQLPEDENGADEGYLVEYLDGGTANVPGYAGYVSWSPKDVFERAYRPVTGLSFGLAVEALKLGKRVARAGWNGKGMWLALVKSGFYDVGCSVIGEIPLGDGFFLPWIGMKTADDKFVPWLASQTDVLADDWLILE